VRYEPRPTSPCKNHEIPAAQNTFFSTKSPKKNRHSAPQVFCVVHIKVASGDKRYERDAQTHKTNALQKWFNRTRGITQGFTRS
jgi:hypothetical protein